MTVGERVKEARLKAGISVDELANKIDKNRSTIYRYESREIEKLPITIVEPLANALGTTVSYLMGWDEKLKAPDITEDFVTFPVIGELAAGFESIAVEDWTGDTIDIPSDYLKGHKASDFIVLKVKGDSMYPFFLEDDKVLILKQSFAESGQYAAVIYDDEYATLKKIEYGKNVLRLIPRNPEYKSKEIYGADIERCYIIGVPKLLIREI